MVKNLPASAGDAVSIRKIRVRKITWKRKWQHTLVFLLRKPHGQRNLVSYSSWGFTRVRHDLVT